MRCLTYLLRASNVSLSANKLCMFAKLIIALRKAERKRKLGKAKFSEAATYNST